MPRVAVAAHVTHVAAHVTHVLPTLAGFLRLDLLSTSSSQCSQGLYALCLPSLQIDIDAACTVAVLPLLGSSAAVFVPGIWSSNPGSTYARLVRCPANWARAPVAAGEAGSATAMELQAAITMALQNHIYGASYPLPVSVLWEASNVTVVSVADGCELTYAITQVSAAVLCSKGAPPPSHDLMTAWQSIICRCHPPMIATLCSLARMRIPPPVMAMDCYWGWSVLISLATAPQAAGLWKSTVPITRAPSAPLVRLSLPFRGHCLAPAWAADAQHC